MSARSPPGIRNTGSAHWTVSPDNTRVAFAVDFTGDREFRIFVRMIATGKVADQGIGDVAANLVFAADSETLFYVRNEAKTVRSYQVWRHRLGADAASDALVYEEKDPTFSVSLELSKSRQFIFMEIDEERTSEVRYLPADRPTDEFKIMEPRRSDVLYHADHVGDRFFIRTNLDAPDYRIVTAPQADAGCGALDRADGATTRPASLALRDVRQLHRRRYRSATATA